MTFKKLEVAEQKWHGDTIEKYLKCIEFSLKKERQRIYFWLEQQKLDGKKYDLWEAIEATVENPPNFDWYYRQEMSKKHNPLTHGF